METVMWFCLLQEEKDKRQKKKEVLIEHFSNLKKMQFHLPSTKITCPSAKYYLYSSSKICIHFAQFLSVQIWKQELEGLLWA